jgi:hypothetical protein
MAPWVLYAVGTTARLVEAVLTGRLGYVGNAATAVSSAASYQQVLSLATSACPLAIAIAGLRAFRERAAHARTTLAILVVAEIVAAAVMGEKGPFVTAVIALAITWTSAGRGMPRRLILAAAAFFLLLAIPFTVAYRAEVRSGPADLSPSAAAAAAPAAAATSASNASAGTISASVSYLAQRLEEIDAPAIVLQRSPSQIPYVNPVQIPETLAAYLIPRAVWPGKPVLDPGYKFSQEYYGTPATEYTAAAVTPEADLYRYGGWVPMITGMALLGYLMRTLDDVLDARANPHAALLVLLLWPALVTPEGPFVATLLGLPGLIFTWVTITFLAFRRQHFGRADDEISRDYRQNAAVTEAA